MRSARYLLAMGLISTGAVFAYSGETMPLAFRMAQALQAAPAAPTPAPSPEPAAAEAVAAPTVQEETTLPRFVPARHDLTFPADTTHATRAIGCARACGLGRRAGRFRKRGLERREREQI